MKKFAICCLVLATVAVLVPSASATTVTTCYVLSSFCDGVQGSKTGAEEAFKWDYRCLKAGTGQIGIGPPKKFGTAPNYPYNTGTPSGFAANFVFNPATFTFNLDGTSDGVTWFYFQHNQGYTPVNGACNPLSPRRGGPAMGR
jgi:hypothetical protein